jgi:hypothetical protein
MGERVLCCLWQSCTREFVSDPLNFVSGAGRVMLMISFARDGFSRGSVALLDCYGSLLLYCWVGGYVERYQSWLRSRAGGGVGRIMVLR